MRDNTITKYLDAEDELHRAQSLLDDLEPSSGARAALESKVAELRLAAISRAVEVTPECNEPIETKPEWNGRGVFSVILCASFWFGAYLLTAFILRRLA